MLNAENKRLHSIPDLCKLNKLKTLKLSKNQLKTIAPGIGNLPALKELRLADNLLEAVPAELGNLKINPFSFSLNGNPLVTVPQAVMDLTNVLESDFPLAQHVCDGLYIGNLGSAANLRYVDVSVVNIESN